MMYGLDALAHGAVAALLTLPPALVLFWWLTRPLAVAVRALRPFVTACAAFGLSMAASGTWALTFERSSYTNEAMGGALIGGGLVGLIGFLILLALPHPP